MIVKSMGPVRSNGVRAAETIDEGSVGDLPGLAAPNPGYKLVLIHIAKEKVIATGWLIVEPAEMFLIIEECGDIALYRPDLHRHGNSARSGYRLGRDIGRRGIALL